MNLYVMRFADYDAIFLAKLMVAFLESLIPRCVAATFEMPEPHPFAAAVMTLH